jgi:hypothetical protein
MEIVRRNYIALLAVAIPTLIRILPEILAGSLPLGFDTVWTYAPFLKSVQSNGFDFSVASVESYHSAPLMYMLLGIVAFSNIEPILITKAVAPLLYGLLGFSLYYFARHGLAWNDRKCLSVAALSSLYFVPLRFSWDLYKNTLGYSFLILALSYLRPNPTPKEKWFFLLLAGLSILASEFTAALLGVICLLIFSWSFVGERRFEPLTVVVASASFLATFFYLGFLFPFNPPLSPLGSQEPLRISLYNYVGASQDVYVYPALKDVYSTVSILTAMVLVPILPLAFLGFYRERRLVVWTFALGIGAFSLTIIPFAAVPMWYRWLLMLTFPMLIFGAAGLARLANRFAVPVLGVMMILSLGFMVLPPENALPYFTNSHTLPYVPSSMLQNTVPLPDSFDIVKALRWLDGTRPKDSVLLASYAFVGWARLYSNVREIYEYGSADQVNNSNLSYYKHVYIIYWAMGSGWFEQSLLPTGTVEVHRSGQIALYELFGP